MFFDNSFYFRFVEDCRAAGIDVPIIPGLKPLTTKRQSSIFPSIFHVDIPEDLYDEVEKCKDNKAAAEVGIEWCTQQTKELVAAGVPCLHFYTMGKSDATKRVAEAVF